VRGGRVGGARRSAKKRYAGWTDGKLVVVGLESVRRNVNLTILLFNNRIYGLTKGQYSPTSEVGKVTKSTPFGSIDPPFNPLSVALGAEASFVARTHDLDRKHMMEIFKAAHDHRGSSFVEIYQNCNVFNDGQFNDITKRSVRDEMMIDLEHGQPILFGADRQRGVAMGRDGHLQLVEVDDVGIDDILVHDIHHPHPSLAFALARLNTDDHSPTPFGIFRQIERQEYSGAVGAQLAAASERTGPGDLPTLLRSTGTWRDNSSPGVRHQLMRISWCLTPDDVQATMRATAPKWSIAAATVKPCHTSW
jgi:2-oxoglutarate ferredoxin oxidoreductase subunit beta